MQEEVTHKEIYNRILILEQGVLNLNVNTSEMLSAFNAAKGAFTALEWIGKIIKPLIIVGTFLAGIAAYWSHK